MTDFILVHLVTDKERLIRKEDILSVEENEGGSCIDTFKAYFNVTEKPHEIFAKLQEPDAIITTDGRVYK